MTSILALAAATYGEITRRPFYYVLLGIAAVFIVASKLLTLFAFYWEMNLVREMGMATITLWGLIIVVINSLLVVTRELEDRTAVLLLTKPLRRSDFLLGKYLGLMAAIVPGMLVLGGTLFVTLYFMAAPNLPVNDSIVARGVEQGTSPFATTWRATWEHFFLTQGAVVLEGTVLSFLQAAILAALAVSFSAFFPMVVTVGAVLLLFVLGNMSGYMTDSVERLGSGPLTLAARGAAYLMPNLGYFNLQTYFSEGRIISLAYVGAVGAYAALYVSAVFLASCSLFRNREVR
jgi:ABC-type transport system involved in multi-copper enzyme maturation permease subunit